MGKLKPVAGMEVWDYVYNYGKITVITIDGIIVDFGDGFQKKYNWEGKPSEQHPANRTLFESPKDFIEWLNKKNQAEPFPELKPGMIVYMKSKDFTYDKEHERHLVADIGKGGICIMSLNRIRSTWDTHIDLVYQRHHKDILCVIKFCSSIFAPTHPVSEIAGPLFADNGEIVWKCPDFDEYV
jgi:hypothetical protein